MVDVNQISTTARTHWWSGTDEIQLARAAREFECDLVLERRSDPEQARRLLIDYLREQTPVLLCVDEWTHWITVVRSEDPGSSWSIRTPSRCCRCAPGRSCATGGATTTSITRRRTRRSSTT